MPENYGGFGASRQRSIYLAGPTAPISRVPVGMDELENGARSVLGPPVFDYVAGAAGGERTARHNIAEFERWHLIPRMLRDVHERDTRVELFGKSLPAPVLFAPVGALEAVRPEGDLAVARASVATGVPMVASTLTTRSLEEIAAVTGSAPHWFQLYWGPDRDLNLSLVQRAEKAGYSALVVTLDTRIIGWRHRDIARAYLPFLGGIGLGNYFSDPVFRSRLERPPEEDLPAAVLRAVGMIGDLTFSWADIRFLSERTAMPIVVKGILHPQDAVDAMEAGANGLIVSNHGGRQLDGSIPSLRALPKVMEEAGTRIPVLLDGGIRSGADIAKALALGARAVLIGRPYVWGLAIDGEYGVKQVTENLLADFDLTLALLGLTKPAELTRDTIVAA
ncbi:MAG TPA: alpha-hydroxy-acid oxidizing protein [Thermoplasmata archaeon]|nr:alpha-hydroxy-acid oxidizing protein [Thermoplasmata archaeon]